MTTIDVSASWALEQRMKAGRVAAGVDQLTMARILGVSRQTVSNWERGTSEPSFTQMVIWAKQIGQPLEWLADGVWVRHEGFEPPTF